MEIREYTRSVLDTLFVLFQEHLERELDEIRKQFEDYVPDKGEGGGP